MCRYFKSHQDRSVGLQKRYSVINQSSVCMHLLVFDTGNQESVQCICCTCSEKKSWATQSGMWNPGLQFLPWYKWCPNQYSSSFFLAEVLFCILFIWQSYAFKITLKSTSVHLWNISGRSELNPCDVQCTFRFCEVCLHRQQIFYPSHGKSTCPTCYALKGTLHRSLGCLCVSSNLMQCRTSVCRRTPLARMNNSIASAYQALRSQNVSWPSCQILILSAFKMTRADSYSRFGSMPLLPWGVPCPSCVLLCMLPNVMTDTPFTCLCVETICILKPRKGEFTQQSQSFHLSCYRT